MGIEFMKREEDIKDDIIEIENEEPDGFNGIMIGGCRINAQIHYAAAETLLHIRGR